MPRHQRHIGEPHTAASTNDKPASAITVDDLRKAIDILKANDRRTREAMGFTFGGIRVVGNPYLPTATICCSPDMAEGLFELLEAKGKNHGEDR